MPFRTITPIMLAAGISAAFVFVVPSAAAAGELRVARLVNPQKLAPQPARRWRAYNRRVKYQDFKVFAVSDDGRAYGMAWSFLSPEWAARTALQRCREKRADDTAPCGIFALGPDIVGARAIGPFMADYRARLYRTLGPAPAGGKPVTEKKMSTHVTYRSFAGKTRWGTDFKLRFRGPEVQFEQGWIAGVMGRGQMGVARWAVDGGRLCLQLAADNVAAPACYQVLEQGDDDAYLLVDAQGDVVATLTP